MRGPTYSPRELAALATAEYVVARVLLSGQWREAEFRPTPEERGSVRAVYLRVVHALRHTPDASGVLLYAVGEGGVRACLPRDPLLAPRELT